MATGPRAEVLLEAIRGERRRSCELQLALFAAALQSYRRDTCLKPFPPAYVRDGVKQYELLLEVFKKIPPMPILEERLEDPTYVDTNGDVVDLLHHLLVKLGAPTVSPVPSKDIDEVMKKAPSAIGVSPPQYIFQVDHGQSPGELKWQSLAQGKNTFFAYHGSRLENFYSIFRQGLQQHMNRVNFYGSGTYLSSEISISLLYSPICMNWECGTLGRYLSCVALCELIDTPDGLISQRAEDDDPNNTPTRRRAPDSASGEIPQKYYVVSNNDLIRVRYLLVYAKDLTSARNQLSSTAQKKSAFREWLSKYKMPLMMLAYVFILTVIGYSNNNSIYYYYKNLYKKFRLTYF